MGAESFLTLQIADFAEGVGDRVAALLQSGAGITLTYDDEAGTLTIANTGLGGSTGSVANRVLTANGTGGSTVQASVVTIDGSGNVSGVSSITATDVSLQRNATGPRWEIRAGTNSSGGLLVRTADNSDNSNVVCRDLQASNDVYCGVNRYIGGIGVQGIQFKNNASILTQIGASGRTCFGSDTSTGSALKNSSGTLQVRLGDDSAAGALDCGAITASGTIAQSGTGVVATFGTDPAVVRIGNEGNAATFVNAYVGGYAAAAGASTVYFGQNLYWSGSAWVRPHTSGNTSLFWQQAGAFYFNTGTGFGTTRVTIAHSGNVTLSALLFCGVYTVATLPSAAANAGALAQVTDSSVTTNGSAVSGGGANRVAVFSNGSTWDVVVA